MKIELQVAQAGPPLAGRHPDDHGRNWVARRAPLLEVHLPWGPDEPGNWAFRNWHFHLRWGTRSWPCFELILGPLYVRRWWRGTTFYWTGHEPFLTTLAHTR